LLQSELVVPQKQISRNKSASLIAVLKGMVLYKFLMAFSERLAAS